MQSLVFGKQNKAVNQKTEKKKKDILILAVGIPKHSGGKGTTK